jgi:hypothetical protein
VNYAVYERIPMRTASATFRALAKTNPLTAKRAFYGNYGGPGNGGERPLDEMDELFRRHDIVYYNARTRGTMLVADAQLIEGLNRIDPSEMSAEAITFRDRAISFFQWPGSRVIGKPWSSFCTRREPEGSYFSSPEAVRRFCSQDHPGMPEAKGRGLSMALSEEGDRESRVGTRSWSRPMTSRWATK